MDTAGHGNASRSPLDSRCISRGAGRGSRRPCRAGWAGSAPRGRRTCPPRRGRRTAPRPGMPVSPPLRRRSRRPPPEAARPGRIRTCRHQIRRGSGRRQRVVKHPLVREDLKVIQYQSQEADNTFITSDGTSPYNSTRKWAVKRHYREDNN